MSAGPIETKAVAGPFATLVAGYVSAVLISSIPWLHQHLTPDQQQSLPIIIAFALSGIAAYLAPHTPRPDLAVQKVVAGVEKAAEAVAPAAEAAASAAVQPASEPPVPPKA